MSILPKILALVLSSSGSQSPLAGCDATAIARGWQYKCKGITARVEDLPDGEAEVASHLAGLDAAAPALVGEGAKTRRERRKVGGEDVEVRITEARGRLAILIAPLRKKAGTRVLACVVEGSRSCSTVMDSLATVPWRSERVFGTTLREPPALSIAGSPVQVPRGCQAKQDGNAAGVTCPPAFFVNWVASPDEAQGRRMYSAFGPAVRDRFAQHGLKSESDEVRCLLAGVETTCARLTVAEPDGRPAAILLWATARAGGQVIFASCQAPPGTPIRSPCSLVFGSP